MALDDLQAVIESLQSKIESHRAHLSENETRTRQVLIDPLLKNWVGMCRILVRYNWSTRLAVVVRIML